MNSSLHNYHYVNYSTIKATHTTNTYNNDMDEMTHRGTIQSTSSSINELIFGVIRWIQGLAAFFVPWISSHQA